MVKLQITLATVLITLVPIVGAQSSERENALERALLRLEGLEIDRARRDAANNEYINPTGNTCSSQGCTVSVRDEIDALFTIDRFCPIGYDHDAISDQCTTEWIDTQSPTENVTDWSCNRKSEKYGTLEDPQCRKKTGSTFPPDDSRKWKERSWTKKSRYIPPDETDIWQGLITSHKCSDSGMATRIRYANRTHRCETPVNLPGVGWLKCINYVQDYAWGCSNNYSFYEPELVISYECADGYTLNNGVCEMPMSEAINLSESINYYCEAGWFLEGNLCWREVDVVVPW